MIRARGRLRARAFGDVLFYIGIITIGLGREITIRLALIH